MFADPAQPGVARQRAFQHGCGIHEDAITERPDLCGDTVGQLLQAVAHQLVIVAAQRVARDVGPFAVVQRGPGLVRVAAVVQPHRNHPQRARHQVGGAAALVAVIGHPAHRAVQPLCQPVAQVGFVRAQFDVGDAAALEAELARQSLDPCGQRVRIGSGVADVGGVCVGLFVGLFHVGSIESGHADRLI